MKWGIIKSSSFQKNLSQTLSSYLWKWHSIPISKEESLFTDSKFIRKMLFPQIISKQWEYEPMEEIRPKDTQERENVNSTNGM